MWSFCISGRYWGGIFSARPAFVLLAFFFIERSPTTGHNFLQDSCCSSLTTDLARDRFFENTVLYRPFRA